MISKQEKPLLDLFCYIVASARGCVEEPKLYGSFRLIETMEKVIDILEEKGESTEISKISLAIFHRK